MLEEGSYLMDVNALFEEAFFNGTIDGTASADETALLSGVLYSDIQDGLRDDARKFNLNTVVSNPSITLDQVDPWNVRIKLQVDLFIEDLGGLVSWNRTAEIIEYIPISNFEDPFYLLNTNGLIIRKMEATPYSIFVSGADVSNLSEHVAQTYYFASNESPSFLNRLEGNFSAHDYGVESFVYLPEFTLNGLPTEDKTVVDHIYFSTTNPTTKSITGMPSWFKIDDAAVARYGLGGVAV